MRVLLSSVVMALLPAAALSAQTFVVHQVPNGWSSGSQTVRLSRAVVGGQQSRLWWATLLNVDCSPEGKMTVQVEQQPRHGTLTVDDGPVYPSYPSYNPRVRCDTQKVPGEQAFYTADAGYHGHDKVILRNITSEGRIRRIVIDVAVS